MTGENSGMVASTGLSDDASEQGRLVREKLEQLDWRGASALLTGWVILPNRGGASRHAGNFVAIPLFGGHNISSIESDTTKTSRIYIGGLSETGAQRPHARVELPFPEAFEMILVGVRRGLAVLALGTDLDGVVMGSLARISSHPPAETTPPRRKPKT